MAEKEFNPIHAARKIENSYRDYIATTIHFDDADLQNQLVNILNEPNYLAKGPFLEAAPPYCKDKSVADLVNEGLLCKSMLSLGEGNLKYFDPDRPLYVHQVRAIKKAVEGHNYAVVTGTGSGKTECFLLPILNDILREFEAVESAPGVRAMILYPMNALANDQLKRLRQLLAGTDITFGRYTGDTQEKEAEASYKWQEENPGQEKMPNEIISREEIRRNPPNILLTNYSMLEYLLLRPEDAALFGDVFGKNWRHIAIDEAHIYSGALGTEIAYLIRRLKARIASETGEKPKLHCYATSATIGSEEDMPKVAVFAQDLFGEPFESEGDDIDVVTSEKDNPVAALSDSPWGSLPLDAWQKLRKVLNESEEVDGARLKACLLEVGVPQDVVSGFDVAKPLESLGQILLAEKSTAKLVMRCESLLDLTNNSNIASIGIDGLEGDTKGVKTLTAMVEVLSAAQRSKDVPILSSRYHSFLRAPEGIFLNLATRKLTPYKTTSVTDANGNETPVYEVSVCRHCGQAYILGEQNSDKESHTAWLSSKHEGIDADDEFIPRTYYRVLNSVADKDTDEMVQWLCPVCGSLHDEPEGGEHLYDHAEAARIPIAKNESKENEAKENEARCRHCGYQSRVAIQPMRVSPEAAGSVVCYDLVREIPPFVKEDDREENWFANLEEEEKRAGSVICFSDKRQDAAFFAPAMERTYGNITVRQLIREAVEAKTAESEFCTPSSVISWIIDSADTRYPGFIKGDKQSKVKAWMLDELAAEDSRNSLEGLGVIRVEPVELNEKLTSPDVQKIINRQLASLKDKPGLNWLTPDDYILIFKECLETLRERSVIEVPEGAAQFRENHEKKGNYVVLGTGDTPLKKDDVAFVGSASTTENKRSRFVRKYAKQVYGVEVERAHVADLLSNIYELLYQLLAKSPWFKNRGYFVGKSSERFRLGMDLWHFYHHAGDDVLYRCDKCGCETHLNTHGVCVTSKCDGHMEEMTFDEALSKDKFYKEVYQEEALPIRIEEHTAQLSTSEARSIQTDFIKGDVNVLSCTTTFELGVDVGDLRAIFMRNVPPSTANYTQRAGRVGRRAGKPGYAVTFARLRPHDVEHFNNPERIIAGATRVPMCYLDNEAIARRHIYAVAISEFFRYADAAHDADYSHMYDKFMSLASKNPAGLEELRHYLHSYPYSVKLQLDLIIPDSLRDSEELDIANWGWLKGLLGEPNVKEDFEGGRLVCAHALKYADYKRLDEARNDYLQKGDNKKVASLSHALNALESQRTIEVLAENGVIPKYGFPTDLVELHLSEIENASGENRLSLSRGMRQAIREYAPGAEVVAGKTLWKSVGIKKPSGNDLITRYYATCPGCKTFLQPIQNYSEDYVCPICGHEIHFSKQMLVPSYGFVGKKVERGVGLRKPRGTGYTKIEFSQNWPSEVERNDLSFAGGKVICRYASNAQLCALNEPRANFLICNVCYCAATGDNTVTHEYWCDDKYKTSRKMVRYNALGTSFVSDVLELDFNLPAMPALEEGGWESVMWALFTAAAKILEIPETELGGTLYRNSHDSFSLMIFDDVPGGAGHTRQLSRMVGELVKEAYHIVDGHCGCTGDTCCYGCIANYYNQGKQSNLSRVAAKKVLGLLLGKDED